MQSKKTSKKTSTNVDNGSVAATDKTVVAEVSPKPRSLKSAQPKKSEVAKPRSAKHHHKAAPIEKVAAPALSEPSTGLPGKTSVANSGPSTTTAITHEQIAELAYSYWASRGRTHGSSKEDWFRAEQELLGS
ncbi:MAG: DUF2934 domain-containing protein [Acidobacteriota bacterium]|nr:DUF2934 domain-containing protein [Acidobacteriota bacterium]